jgi:hypothetical protein
MPAVRSGWRQWPSPIHCRPSVQQRITRYDARGSRIGVSFVCKSEHGLGIRTVWQESAPQNFLGTDLSPPAPHPHPLRIGRKRRGRHTSRQCHHMGADRGARRRGRGRASRLKLMRWSRRRRCNPSRSAQRHEHHRSKRQTTQLCHTMPRQAEARPALRALAGGGLRSSRRC